MCLIKKIDEVKWREELFSGSFAEQTTFGVGKVQVNVSLINNLEVLSYNLNILPLFGSFFGTGQGTFSSDRLEKFIQVIEKRSVNYDVMALQEVFGSPFSLSCKQRYLISRLKELGYDCVKSYHSTLELLAKRKWTDSGLLIFSKFKIVANESFSFEVMSTYV